MNILILSGHPAQVHNFRLLKKELEFRGHSVFWAATRKDISHYLLDYYSIHYVPLRKPQKTVLSKIITLFRNAIICISLIRRNKIDIIISRVSPYGSVASFICNKPHIALADTESSGFYDTIFTKLITVFITATSYKRHLHKDQICYDGNIELFYLHPSRFTPSPRIEIEKMLNLDRDEKFIIMRFVSWDAYHDKGLSGFSDENKIRAVKEFSNQARVFISAEKELPSNLECFRIQIPPEQMHNLLAHASFFFGESATMASESAILGTPSIYLDKVGRGYTEEEERYGLLYNYFNDDESQLKAIQKGLDLLSDDKLKEKIFEKRSIFLKDKIDPTAFLTWFIENYPDSFAIVKQNPLYLNRFK